MKINKNYRKNTDFFFIDKAKENPKAGEEAGTKLMLWEK